MKKILSCILATIAFLCLSFPSHAIDINISDIEEIDKVSFNVNPEGDSTVEKISDIILDILNIAKYIFSGVVLIYIVYIWAEMIMYMWDNEEQLSNAKRQIWYSVVAILIINIPGDLYQAISRDYYWNVTWGVNGQWTNDSNNSNILIDFFQFNDTLNGVVWWLEVIIWSVAILMIVYSGIRMITARWNEDVISNAKKKLYTHVLVWYS